MSAASSTFVGMAVLLRSLSKQRQITSPGQLYGLLAAVDVSALSCAALQLRCLGTYVGPTSAGQTPQTSCASWAATGHTRGATGQTPGKYTLNAAHAAAVSGKCLGPPDGRRLATAAASSAAHDNASLSVSLSVPTFAVWGANTGVGKTLVSAGLASAIVRATKGVLFLKPVQTGFPEDSDARTVAAACGASELLGPHARHLVPGSTSSESSSSSSSSQQPADEVAAIAKTLFAWQQAVGPHLAAQREGRGVADAELRKSALQELQQYSQAGAQGWVLLETAGGVASPSPSGQLQCDTWRPLRLPAVLVGDGKLGGISTTAAAHDTLRLRGYDIATVVVLETEDMPNSDALRRHFGDRTPVISLPLCPPPDGRTSGKMDAALAQWLQDTAASFDALLDVLGRWHTDRLQLLHGAADAARRDLWWPFTQHMAVPDVMVIDSRSGEQLAVLGGAGHGAGPEPVMESKFDACASWWTQGVSAELQPRLAESIAYAAGRYGHVMFPENAHQPALDVARKLLDSVGQGWASRVFFSDDGSTAVEVALKMAFRKYLADHELLDDIVREEEERQGGAAPADLKCRIGVLGLQHGYHGDTLGAMDAVPRSVFNGSRQSPWFQSRGLFLEPPTVGLMQGRWRVCLDQQDPVFADLDGVSVASRDELFTESRDNTDLADAYMTAIEAAIEEYEGNPGDTNRPLLGACLMEPVLQGAGGMVLVDPLFQRMVARACAARRIPLILDEVFSGLWRLGAPSAAQLLGIHPDIACYAKLLTGGMLPLAVTVASDAVFSSFSGPTKVEALLHGHSYTAHPIGCSVACTALDLYSDPHLNCNLCTPASQAGLDGSCPRSPQCGAACGRLTELWDPKLVQQLSHHPSVQRVMSLGTVLAAELHPEGGVGGYTSNVARKVVDRLRPHGIYARPLGNVVYLMCTPTTDKATCRALLSRLLQEL